MPHNHTPRNAQLEGMSGLELRASFDGAMRQFHNQIYDLRAAFANLPHSDPDRDAGLAITELSDTSFHTLQQQIGLLATVCTAYILGRPMLLIEKDDDSGQVMGLEVWMPNGPLE